MTRFDERGILLTGTARGLGRATARLLSKRGGSLGLVDILEQEVVVLAAELVKTQSHPLPICRALGR